MASFTRRKRNTTSRAKGAAEIVMTTIVHWVKREMRYASMGLRLGKVTVGLRSRILIGLLGIAMPAKQRTRWRKSAVCVKIRMADGPVFPVLLGGRTDLEVLHEITLEDEYGLSDHIDASTIVDLGAHIGLATLRLLAVRPDARVIAVEADPVLVERLRANVAGLAVTVVHAAICGTNGQRRFFRADDSTWGNSLTRTLPWQEEVTVPSMTLSRLMETEALASVDLLKMDIEGAEWEVLANGVPDAVRAFVGEIHAQGDRKPHELLRSVSECMDIEVTRGDLDRLVFAAARSEATSRDAAGFVPTRDSGRGSHALGVSSARNGRARELLPGQRLDLVCVAINAPTHTFNGDEIRVRGLLRALAEHHDVRFVGARRPEDTAASIASLAELCRGGLDLYPPPADRSQSLGAKSYRWAHALSHGTPTRILGHHVPDIADHLETLAPNCDAVVLLDNAVAVYWRSLRHARRRIVDVHQVDGWPLARGDKPSFGAPLLRLRRELDAELMCYYEKRSLESMDGIIVTSDDEAARLDGLYGLAASAVVPSAIDVPERVLRSPGAGTVAWLGGLRYAPNRSGLIRFVREGWRPLGEAGYRLLVAGAGATEDVKALEGIPGVNILGFVEDLESFLSDIDVAVVPLWEGAGVKLKSVTFMGAGIPVASTTIGLEGTGARDGEHALVRETSMGLSEGLRTLLTQPDLADRLGASGRALVTRRLSWTIVGETFRTAVERVVVGRAWESPAPPPVHQEV